MERRLSAILAADMVGYSRLMEADEIGTLERQKVHREELVDPAFEEFHGRIVKEMGDGVLVEFPSVVDAVRCAVAIQRAMPGREAANPEDRRITYRIGINLGDIIVGGDDIYGDGVNIAARLEALAEPGGICISGTAYDHLRSTIEVGYESLGEIRVKNIARPIRAYKVLTEAAQAGTIIEKPKARIHPRYSVALGLILLLVIGTGGWWWSLRPDFEPADPDKFAFTLPDIPSIAVLPFKNLSRDPSNDYLGDSLTENIIAELSTVPELLVIARNSVFTFKDKSVKVQEVAEELGVKYILEGSVQTDGNQMRIVTQLVDALDGTHLWSERYDYSVSDIFAVQDDITQKLAEELEVKLTTGEQARKWRDDFKSPDAYRKYIEGRAGIASLSPDGHKTAGRLFNELYAMNPDNPAVLRLMSWLHSHKTLYGWDRTESPEGHWKKAREFAKRYGDHLGDETTSDYHMLVAWLDFWERKFEAAVAHADQAAALAPSSADVYNIGGLIKVSGGQPTEAIDWLRTGMRLEPVHPPYVEVMIAYGQTKLGKFDRAISTAQSALPKTAGGIDTQTALRLLVANHVFTNKLSDAKGYLDRLLEINPKESIEARRLTLVDSDTAFVERLIGAYRKAGMPERPAASDK